ncbi:MAG: hypothetical protein U1E76_15695 [Planctomycetota bacterium]
MGLIPNPFIVALLSKIALATPCADDFSYRKARELALGGQRAAAIAMLEQHLLGAPDDSDARVLLGSVLSGVAYEEARSHLQIVLAHHPHHGDALPALLNVELWSGLPRARRRDRAPGAAG